MIRPHATLLAAVAIASGALRVPAPHAATFHVDGGNGACTDAGPGTPVSPYCTITAALAAHHAPGTTIRVMPGVYREQVTVPASGTASGRIVLQAVGGPGAPVVVNGANDFADPARWTPFQQDVWLAASVDWSPLQVFKDGVRLQAYTGDPALMPAGRFMYAAGTGLYVNAGGGNPGTFALEVGRRPFGFLVSNRSWITVTGFTVTRCEDRGIQLSNGAHHVDVTGDTITLAGRFGVQANACSTVTIARCLVSDNADHGIALLATTGALIEGNESCRNVFPGTRRANGINLFASPANVIRANRLHDNQDTGLQLQPGANGNLLVQNVSWSNGDHGFDVLRATDCLLIGNVAFANAIDGFSIEGNAHHTSLYDCIAVDNGLGTVGFDLWVDDSSSVGFVSDDNLFWNSTAQAPIKYRTTVYPTVAGFGAASGTDTRTLQADPRFVAPATGDFHLMAGSPAIDNANSGVPFWPALDAEGNARGDDPSAPNQGLGPVSVADRGAHEYTAGGTVAVAPPRDHGSGGADGEASVAPNPMHAGGAGGSLAFSLARPGPLSVGIFDLRGRLIRNLLEEHDAPAGRRVLAFDARTPAGEPLVDGVYFYRIRSAAGVTMGRFIVTR